MTGSVMVPLDGSPLAEQALPVAIRLAQEEGKGLALVQVVPEAGFALRYLPIGEVAPVELMEALRESAERYLRQVAAQVEGLSLAVEVVVLKGEVGEKLANWANEQEAAYVVMSTHGHTGLSRWTLGSVADRVLRSVRRPLVIIPPVKEEVLPFAIPSAYQLQTALPQMRRIVVPLDGSLLAEQVLLHVVKLAKRYSSEVLLFRVLPDTILTVMKSNDGSLEATWYETVRMETESYLERQVIRLRLEGLSVRSAIASAPIAEAILDYAANEDADLIAMTTHAYGPLGRLLLGSVTDRVVRAGERPVLVTRVGTKG